MQFETIHTDNVHICTCTLGGLWRGKMDAIHVVTTQEPFRNIIITITCTCSTFSHVHCTCTSLAMKL